MKPLKEKVSITLDGNIVERIKELAEDDDRSFSQYINMVDALFFCPVGIIWIKEKKFICQGATQNVYTMFTIIIV